MLGITFLLFLSGIVNGLLTKLVINQDQKLQLYKGAYRSLKSRYVEMIEKLNMELGGKESREEPVEAKQRKIVEIDTGEGSFKRIISAAR